MKRGKPRGGLTDGCGSPQIPCFLGGRSFMGAGNKTTFMMTKARPEGRPYAPTHVSESLIVGRQAGLSIASWGGVRGPFRWNFTLYIRLFVYVIKSPPPALSCPSRTRSKASTRAIPMVFGPGRNGKPSRAASRTSTARAPIASAVYGSEIELFAMQEWGKGPRGARDNCCTRTIICV